MVKRRSWVNIAVCLCLHPSFTHHRNIENKVWEIHIFIKKCVRSFIEVRKSMLESWLYNTLLRILTDLRQLEFWGSLLVLLFLSALVPVTILKWMNWAHRLQLVLPLFSYSIVIFRSLARTTYLSVCFFQFYPVVNRNGKIHYSVASLFCWLLLGLVV